MAYQAGLALLKQSAAAVATSREGHRLPRSDRADQRRQSGLAQLESWTRADESERLRLVIADEFHVSRVGLRR
jgi:hypothetical protein